MTHDDDIATVAGLIKDAKIAMLTTVGADGSLVSRPMGVLRARLESVTRREAT